MLIIYIPLYVDTATVASSRHVTPNGSLSEQGISLSNVPSSLRPSVKSINDIKLTLHTTFNILKGKGNNVITGSFVSPYGKMIYVENHNILLVILNEDGTFDKEIPCSLSDPLDVTCLDDATVAVSTFSGI
jgi:hypothetical protein